jgi:hypothetical protein
MMNVNQYTFIIKTLHPELLMGEKVYESPGSG